MISDIAKSQVDISYWRLNIFAFLNYTEFDNWIVFIVNVYKAFNELPVLTRLESSSKVADLILTY